MDINPTTTSVQADSIIGILNISKGLGGRENGMQRIAYCYKNVN